MIPRTLEHNLVAPSVPPVARRSPASAGPLTWPGALSRWLASDAAEAFSRRLALVLMPAVALMIGVAVVRGAYQHGEMASRHEVARLTAVADLALAKAGRLAETKRLDGDSLAMLQTAINDCERRTAKKGKRR